MIAITRTLRRGMRGADVSQLQDRLRELAYIPLATKSDGSFGPLTEAAVIGFQSRSGLKADGVVGKQTLAALFVDPYEPGDVVVTVPKTAAQFAAKYRAAKIRPEKLATVQKRAALLLKFKDRYAAVAKTVLGSADLWWVPACIHNQESGSDVGVFKACLHNGERIVGTGRKTSLVPAGKGPFATWEEAAIDALRYDKLDRWTDWSIGGALYKLIRFNGLGYDMHGVASPYIWAMTDQYTKGHYGEKVGADGKPHSTWYPNKVSQNYGIASILMVLGIKA